MAAAQPTRQPLPRVPANDGRPQARAAVVYMPFEDAEEERLWDDIMRQRGLPT